MTPQRDNNDRNDSGGVNDDEWREDSQWNSDDSSVVFGEPTDPDPWKDDNLDGFQDESQPLRLPGEKSSTPSSGTPLNEEELRKRLLSNPAAVALLCGVYGVSSMMQGFVAGSIFGAFTTILEGAKAGVVSQPGFARSVAVASIANGASLSIWIATYSATTCSCSMYRGKKDYLNNFAGGFAAGCVVTARSRSPRLILLSGLGNGALFAAFEVFLGRGPSVV